MTYLAILVFTTALGPSFQIEAAQSSVHAVELCEEMYAALPEPLYCEIWTVEQGVTHYQGTVRRK